MDALFKGPTTDPTNVEAVKLGFGQSVSGSRREFRGDVTRGGSPLPGQPHPTVRAQAVGERCLSTALDCRAQQRFVIAPSNYSQVGADVQLVVRNVLLELIEHELPSAVVEVLEA